MASLGFLPGNEFLKEETVLYFSNIPQVEKMP
jgi:hypothetical protein